MMMTEEGRLYERKRELMKYIELLMNLKRSGIKCEQEISEALKELNSLILPK